MSINMSIMGTVSYIHLHHHHHPQVQVQPYQTISNTNSKPTTTHNQFRDIEIRVCTNRTCRLQGSLRTHDTLLGIAPPHVTVTRCGCLGRCGAGPNLVVLPNAVAVAHCATAAAAARIMVDICDGGGGGGGEVVRRSLEALALRKRAEIEADRGELSKAEALFSQVIEANPIGGVHLAYKSRSAVRLAAGNSAGALEDAKEALILHPKYGEAFVCQGDAFLYMDQVEAAEESYNMALETDPSLRRSKSFKAKVEKLKEKKASSTISS